MWTLALGLALLGPTLTEARASSPEAHVKTLYAAWKRVSDGEATPQAFVSRHRAWFTPEAARLLAAAYDLAPDTDGRYVDFDLFVGGQVGFFSVSVGEARVQGVRAVVPVFVRLGLRPPGQVQGVKVRLVRGPSGWQVEDVDHGGGITALGTCRALLAEPSGDASGHDRAP